MTESTEKIILQMLSDLKDGQRALRDKLDESVGETAKLRERVAKLEADAVRWVSYKQLLTWMLGGAGGGSTIAVGLYHFITTNGG